jgi:hypothetical protein
MDTSGNGSAMEMGPGPINLEFSSGALLGLPGAQLLTGDFNGDGKTDVLLFRSSDGYVAQWLSNGVGG